MTAGDLNADGERRMTRYREGDERFSADDFRPIVLVAGHCLVYVLPPGAIPRRFVSRSQGRRHEMQIDMFRPPPPVDDWRPVMS
jgi:hypothetical protein